MGVWLSLEAGIGLSAWVVILVDVAVEGVLMGSWPETVDVIETNLGLVQHLRCAR